jgi:hypothetical protein
LIVKRFGIFLSLLFALTTAQAQLRYPYAIKPPAACSSVQMVQYVTADSALTCHQVAYTEVSGTPTLYNQTIKENGTSQTQRPTLNLISGSGATVSCTDNSGATRTDCTIAATGTGTVTTTGSPASGNLTKFSGATSITNGDVSGDCTTSGTLAITCTKTSGTPFATVATSGSKTDVGLSNVTNDAQTKAAIVPNTAPLAGQVLVANITGTSYAPVTLSGSGATATLTSAGVLTLSAIPNATLSNPSMTIAGHSVALGGTQAIACSDLSDSSIFCAATGANNAQTGTYQVLAADFTNLKTITVASGTFTITLVASGSQPANGKYINIINYGSGVVTIARSGQNINGGTASLSIPAASATAPTSAAIYSNGTDYFASLVAGGSGSSPLTTKGDLLAHSTVDARLGVGADGQTLFSDSTQSLGLAWANSAMPLRYGLHDSDDLIYGLASNGLGGRISCNGVSGGGIGLVTVAGHPGVQGITTGNTNGGDTRCGMAFTAATSGSSGMLHPGDGAFEAVIVFETTTLSAASPGRYLFVAGLSDLNTPASYTGNLIALVYSDNINGGAVVLDVVTAGTAVVTNGTTALAANSWYSVRIVENAAYTQVDLYTRNLSTQAAEVHEVSVSGLVAGTTLPATSVGMGLVADLLNQNGATSSSVNLDGMEYTYMLTNKR